MSHPFALQSTLPLTESADLLHVALILDGNGRWAARRGLPRSAGHRAGARTVQKIVEAATQAGIDVLTLYAFSADNWKRPALEVRALMDLFERYLDEQTEHCGKHDLRLNIIGRRDRLRVPLQDAIARAERHTLRGQKLLLRIAVDYSSRHTLACAANRLASGPTTTKITESVLAHALEEACHSVTRVPAVDLLVRTGGEQRLSDFLLWECAYAEFIFSPTMWPDFTAFDLQQAVTDYLRRERRFGGISKRTPKRTNGTPLTFTTNQEQHTQRPNTLAAKGGHP